jgi:hypothetical protein
MARDQAIERTIVSIQDSRPFDRALCMNITEFSLSVIFNNSLEFR